jgi:hypothetical protein
MVNLAVIKRERQHCIQNIWRFSHLCGTVKPLLIKLFNIDNVPLANRKHYSTNECLTP